MKRIASIAIVVSLLFIFSNPLVAATTNGDYGEGTYGSCAYGAACSISITSSGSVSLNVAPTTSGVCTTQSDSVAVLTDDANGYMLTMNDNSTNTALLNGGSSISSTTGTFASPAALTDNSWGYRVDSLGSFGSGPTTSQSNTALNSTTFAAIEASNVTPDTLASTSTAADPAVTTTVWYGVCADSTIPSGSYTTQVTYTALAN